MPPMKRIVQLLIVLLVPALLMSFLIFRPKRAMEKDSNVADWMPDDAAPAIEYGTSGFEVIHGETDKPPVSDDAQR